LSRRDDLWSFFFVILDFLNGTLPWSNCKDSNADDVKQIKEQCLIFPEKYLWPNTLCDNQEMRNIFYAINCLKYEDKPNYLYIRQQLVAMLNTETQKEFALSLQKNQVLIGGKRKLKHFSLPSFRRAAESGGKSHKAVFKIEKLSVPEDQFKLLVDVEYYRKLYAE
jgi:hypothetical protein